MCLDHGRFPFIVPRACHSRGGGMLVRAAAAVTVLLIGLAGPAGPALAQFFPPAPPQILPLPLRPLPPVEAEDDEVPTYDPPPGYGRPTRGPYALPPRANDPIYVPPPPQYGRRGAYPEDSEPYGVPPVYRELPPGYEPIDPRSRGARPNIGAQPAPGQQD